MSPLEIATTIRDQIRATDPMALFAWGARNFSYLHGKHVNDRYFLGGLQFKVSGAKQKGSVQVWLRADDTYSIDILNTRGTLKAHFDEIYFDTLMETIDHAIER